jgi:hypothetical protein
LRQLEVGAMKKQLAAAALAAALVTGPALAVDPVYYDDMNSSYGSFAWEGFYAGVLGGFWNGNSPYVQGGVQFGANFLLDGNFLLGFDGRAVVYSDGDVGFDGAGRAGLMHDRFLFFVDAGVGMRDGDPHVFGGGGIEVAVMDNVSIAGRVEAVTGTGFNAIRGETSLLFHF